MERIQAIAQNVSDIAVKVDQILHHSLLLHSKGGPGAPSNPRASVRTGHPGWGPDFSHSRVAQGSAIPTGCEGAKDSS